MRRFGFCAAAAMAAVLLTSQLSLAAVVDFDVFKIRNNNSSITAPWDGDMTIVENAAGDGFSAATPRGGQKVGYGTNAFDGLDVNTIMSANFDRISGKVGVVPYLNMWVTDGTNYAVISSENDYRGTDFGARQEWKIFEYSVGAGLDWLFDSGIGARDGSQYLTLGGTRVTLSQLSSSITLADPGAPYPSYVGTGAPRGGYGFNVIFGDTQSNYTGSYHLDNLTVKVLAPTAPLGFVEFAAATAPVPEPTTLAIWATLGGLGLIAARRRRK